MQENLSETQSLIQQLYGIVDRLEEMYPGRRFTLDGHLVGSLGEIYAAEQYGLELFEASHPVHDAKVRGGKRLVQIKATQRSRVGLGDCPDYLIVLLLSPDGTFEEVYNGPGKPAWDAAGKMMKNGQRFISLAKLRVLSQDVPASKLIARAE